MIPSFATLKLIGWAVIAFAFIACLAALRLEQAQNGKLKAQLHECAEARKADSTAKNNQRTVTADRIRTVTRTIHDADGRAKVIENAKPVPNCGTPQEVLHADI